MFKNAIEEAKKVDGGLKPDVMIDVLSLYTTTKIFRADCENAKRLFSTVPATAGISIADPRYNAAKKHMAASANQMNKCVNEFTN